VAPVGHGSAALLSRLWLALGVANFIPQEISGLLPAAYPFRNFIAAPFWNHDLMKLTTRLHSVSPSDFVNRMSLKWTGALQALPELQPGTYEILHALLNQAASDILELYFQRLQFVK